jgi:hypothetical protein
MRTETNEIALDRDALYYPFLRIPDANWLKATLLCFPHIHRMVPSTFDLADPEEIRAFTKVKGPRGEPLLIDDEPGGGMVDVAQYRLLAKMKEDFKAIYRKYSFAKAAAEFGNMDLLFPIYSVKMISNLTDFLIKERFGALHQGEYGQWIYLHPQLGKAIMSTIAIAIANDKGLDIVTSSDEVHHKVIANNDNEVFEELIGGESKRVQPSSSDTVDDIAEVVMSTTFDLSKLTAEDIGNLVRDGKDLRRFKNALMPIAQTIPHIQDAGERNRRLCHAANEVVEEWKKYRKTLPRFALDALSDATEVKFPEIASSLIAGASGLRLGVGAGLAISLLTYSGVKIWRKYRENSASPYQYLSRIQESGATLTLPPGIKR